MDNKRIYVVTDGDVQRMIEAATPSQAIRHATRGRFTAKPAGARDVAYLMGRGVIVETADVAEPATAALPLAANDPPAAQDDAQKPAADGDATTTTDATAAPQGDATPAAGDPPAEAAAMAAAPGAEGAALAARLTGGKSRKASK